MKKLFIISAFFLIFTIQGKSDVFVQKNVIECPPGFNMENDELVKKFDIKIRKFQSEKSDKITKVLVNANVFFNGYSVPTSGSIHFQPAITLKEVSESLANTEKHLPPVATFQDGVISCQYSYSSHGSNNEGKSLFFTIDTSKIGSGYQCPLRQDIKAIDTQETGVVLVKALPVCDGKFKGSCENYKVEEFLNRKFLKDEKGRPGYLNLETPDQLGFVYDLTSKNVNHPMVYKKMNLKGSGKVYTYQYQGFFGNIILDSLKVDDANTFMPFNKVNDGSHESFQVTDPDLLSLVNRGFELDKENRPIGYRGELVMPPCRETRIVKVDGEKRIECLYGNSDKEKETIVLTNKYNIDHDIKRENCTIWGTGYEGQNLKSLMEDDKKDFSSVSLHPDGTFEPPVFIFCQD